MSIETGRGIPEELTDFKMEDTQESELVKAEQEINERLAALQTEATTLELLDQSGRVASKLDIGALTPDALSPEQKQAIATTVANEKFHNLKAAPDLVESLLKNKLIDTKQAGSTIKGMFKTRTDRFVPRALLNNVAKSDSGFAQDMAEIANQTLREWQPTIEDPNANPDLRLTGVAKVFKLKDLAEHTAFKPFTEKREIVAAKDPALKELFEDRYAPVHQLKLLTEGNARDVFEVKAVPPERIPEMFKNVVKLMQEKPQYQDSARALKESAVNLVKMGLLETASAKEAIAAINNLK